ncbi:MAG: NADH-quinone oxidoreductase subunit [Solirubrobacteraceae bacterium]|jgi:NADH-quinone oxidoreductase subunit M|nr:NADH-quinone oxidoreductase subunit [Solirubrobacteraceae bacterium]
MALSILIWLPALSGVVAALWPARWAPRVTLAGAVFTLGMAVGYVVSFDRGAPGLQWVTDRTWIGELGIHYKLGLDGLNLFLVLVTALLFAAALLHANLRDWERPRLFYAMFALAESAVLGAFLAQDLALFVVFFDLMLIPFYFLIGAWGRGDRVRATTKLVIYTLVGSLFMLAGAVATGVIASQGGNSLSFALSDLAQVQLAKGTQEWIFLCFAVAFLVKMPLFPLHGWMPDGYRAMPLPVLAVFSAVLSKVAAYGFLRIVLPLFPDASAHFQDLMLLIALASILYGSILAFTQTDLRLILGFSSMAQLGFIVLGIFSLRPEGAQGALLQMVNHALVVVPLFFIVGALAARAGGSEDVREMGGMAARAPVLAAVFLIAALANLAMPGFANFVGEFYILLGVFKAKLVIALVASTGVVLASVYMLRAFVGAMHNRGGAGVESRELSLGEAATIVPLVVCVIALAVYPQLPLARSQDTVKASVRSARLVANAP